MFIGRDGCRSGLTDPMPSPETVAISCGQLSARLRPAWGGRMTHLHHADYGDILVPTSEDAFEPFNWPRAGAYPLFPYHNRLYGGAFVHAGIRHGLSPHPALAPDAMHGPAHRRAWEISGLASDRAGLVLDYEADGNGPFLSALSSLFCLKTPASPWNCRSPIWRMCRHQWRWDGTPIWLLALVATRARTPDCNIRWTRRTCRPASRQFPPHGRHSRIDGVHAALHRLVKCACAIGQVFTVDRGRSRFRPSGCSPHGPLSLPRARFHGGRSARPAGDAAGSAWYQDRRARRASVRAHPAFHQLLRAGREARMALPLRPVFPFKKTPHAHILSVKNRRSKMRLTSAKIFTK